MKQTLTLQQCEEFLDSNEVDIEKLGQVIGTLASIELSNLTQVQIQQKTNDSKFSHFDSPQRDVADFIPLFINTSVELPHQLNLHGGTNNGWVLE